MGLEASCRGRQGATHLEPEPRRPRRQRELAREQQVSRVPGPGYQVWGARGPGRAAWPPGAVGSCRDGELGGRCPIAPAFLPADPSASSRARGSEPCPVAAMVMPCGSARSCPKPGRRWCGGPPGNPKLTVRCAGGRKSGAGCGSGAAGCRAGVWTGRRAVREPGVPLPRVWVGGAGGRLRRRVAPLGTEKYLHARRGRGGRRYPG